MTTDVDVCIVGAGPVGLALAIELRGQGVTCTLVEKSDRVSPQPRAKLTNIRSMELLRRWGLANTVRSAAPLPELWPSDIIFVTRLTGWELARFPDALSTARRPDAPFPEPAQQIPQPDLERVLRTRSSQLGAVTLTGHELVDIDQRGDRIAATVVRTDGTGEERISARYLAACDGSRSTTRDLVGVAMLGERDLGRNLGIVFDSAELGSVIPHGRAVHYWCVNPDVPSILGPLDGQARWWLQATSLPSDFDPDRADPTAMIHAACGLDVDLEVVGLDPWTAHRLLADKYRVGNVFVLGDAAHLHPPMGGYGMNIGLGDALDLGWKLGAVLRGGASESLLDTYEIERRPVHERILEESASNYALISNDLLHPHLEDTSPAGEQARRRIGERILDQKAREFRSIGAQLGVRYEQSPIIVTEEAPEPPNPVDTYAPTARPGHRLPHVWLDENTSVLDCVGAHYTLLSFTDDQSVTDAFIGAARRRRLPLHVAHLSEDLRPTYGATYVLVRPDHHVAWRGDVIDIPGDVLDVLRGVHTTDHFSTGATR